MILFTGIAGTMTRFTMIPGVGPCLLIMDGDLVTHTTAGDTLITVGVIRITAGDTPITTGDIRAMAGATIPRTMEEAVIIRVITLIIQIPTVINTDNEEPEVPAFQGTTSEDQTLMVRQELQQEIKVPAQTEFLKTEIHVVKTQFQESEQEVLLAKRSRLEKIAPC